MLNKNGIPLYLQLKQKLLEDIQSNYKVNDVIPAEGKIEEKYKVSRITVRKAIEELEKANIVEKKQGKGTFVKGKKISYDANFVGSLTQRLAKQKRKLTTKDVSFEIIKEKHFVKDILKCNTVLCLKRTRYLDGIPFALMYNYFDMNLVENLQEDFKDGSLYAFLKKEYKLEIFSAQETIEAIASSKEQAQKLQIKENFPLLSLQRISFDKNDSVIEFSKIMIKSDMYQHKILLTKEKGI